MVGTSLAAPALSVLIAGDNHDGTDSLALLVRHSGHHARVVRDGQEALVAATTDPPDLLLSDLGLPKLNGCELARRLSGLPSKPFLVAVSWFGSDSDRERTQAAGFDLHLLKPVDPDTLRTLLAGRASELGSREGHWNGGAL